MGKIGCTARRGSPLGPECRQIVCSILEIGDDGSAAGLEHSDDLTAGPIAARAGRNIMDAQIGKNHIETGLGKGQGCGHRF